jgi:hypothetical protein
MMFPMFAVTYALMKISVEAGHPDFGSYFPNQIKRSAIKQAKDSNRGRASGKSPCLLSAPLACWRRKES